MAKVLNSNVVVDEKWYGPDYGNAATVPDDVAERIGAHAWSDDEQAADVTSTTGDDGPKPLDKMTKDELVAAAEAHDPPLDSSGTKADILERLQAADVTS